MSLTVTVTTLSINPRPSPGYVNKASNQPDFSFVRLNVSEDEVLQGLDVHARLGAGELKHRTEISPTNIMKKALAYWTFKLGSSVHEEGMTNILLKMMHTTKFYPSSRWCAPMTGLGLSKQRANAIWKAYLHPEDLDEDEIDEIFFTEAPPGRRHAADARD